MLKQRRKDQSETLKWFTLGMDLRGKRGERVRGRKERIDSRWGRKDGNNQLISTAQLNVTKFIGHNLSH